jgi:glycine/D-amino acid oxidase-like deaminating enzyme
MEKPLTNENTVTAAHVVVGAGAAQPPSKAPPDAARKLSAKPITNTVTATRKQGGAREGAGKPAGKPGTQMVPFSFTTTPDVAAKLVEVNNRSKLITTLLEAHFGLK